MKKKWLRYILFILFMCCFIFGGKASVEGAQEYIHNNFRMPVFWLIINSAFPYIGFGSLLGLNYFLKEKRKRGKWHINLSKFIIVGIPSLIFSYSIHHIFLFHIPLDRFGGFLYNQPYMILFRVLFGYVVATSFYKENNAGEINVKE